MGKLGTLEERQSEMRERLSAPEQLEAEVRKSWDGAIGYTTEHDLHLWMKRVWGLALQTPKQLRLLPRTTPM